MVADYPSNLDAARRSQVQGAKLMPPDKRPMWAFVSTWILIIPLLFFTVDSKFSFFNPDRNSVIGGLGMTATSDAVSLQGRALLFLMVAIISLLVVPHLRQILNTLIQLRVLAVLSLLPLISTAWSIDRTATVKGGTWLLLSTFFAIYFANRLTPERQIQVLWMTGVIAASASVLTALLFPGIGREYQSSTGGQWQGIFTNKNGCASSIFFLMLPSLLMQARRPALRAAKAASIVLFVGLIFMTHSVTGRIMMASCFVLLPSVRLLGKFKSLDRLVMMLLALIPVAIVIALTFWNLPELLAYFGRDTTFTGRSDIWKALLVSIMKRPLLGYGYQAFWQGLNGESANVLITVHWLTGYAHNGILELWVGLGATSVVLFLFSLAKAFRDAISCFRVGRLPYIDLYVVILVYTILYNISEASLLANFNLVWFLYIVACVVLHREAKLSSPRKLSAVRQQDTEAMAIAG